MHIQNIPIQNSPIQNSPKNHVMEEKNSPIQNRSRRESALTCAKFRIMPYLLLANSQRVGATPTVTILFIKYFHTFRVQTRKKHQQTI